MAKSKTTGATFTPEEVALLKGVQSNQGKVVLQKEEDRTARVAKKKVGEVITPPANYDEAHQRNTAKLQDNKNIPANAKAKYDAEVARTMNGIRNIDSTQQVSNGGKPIPYDELKQTVMKTDSLTKYPQLVETALKQYEQQKLAHDLTGGFAQPKKDPGVWDNILDALTKPRPTGMFKDRGQNPPLKKKVDKFNQAPVKNDDTSFMGDEISPISNNNNASVKGALMHPSALAARQREDDKRNHRYYDSDGKLTAPPIQAIENIKTKFRDSQFYTYNPDTKEMDIDIKKLDLAEKEMRKDLLGYVQNSEWMKQYQEETNKKMRYGADTPENTANWIIDKSPLGRNVAAFLNDDLDVGDQLSDVMKMYNDVNQLLYDTRKSNTAKSDTYKIKLDRTKLSNKDRAKEVMTQGSTGITSMIPLVLDNMTGTKLGSDISGAISNFATSVVPEMHNPLATIGNISQFIADPSKFLMSTTSSGEMNSRIMEIMQQKYGVEGEDKVRDIINAVHSDSQNWDNVGWDLASVGANLLGSVYSPGGVYKNMMKLTGKAIQGGRSLTMATKIGERFNKIFNVTDDVLTKGIESKPFYDRMRAFSQFIDTRGGMIDGINIPSARSIFGGYLDNTAGLVAASFAAQLTDQGLTKEEVIEGFKSNLVLGAMNRIFMGGIAKPMKALSIYKHLGKFNYALGEKIASRYTTANLLAQVTSAVPQEMAVRAWQGREIKLDPEFVQGALMGLILLQNDASNAREAKRNFIKANEIYGDRAAKTERMKQDPFATEVTFKEPKVHQDVADSPIDLQTANKSTIVEPTVVENPIEDVATPAAEVPEEVVAGVEPDIPAPEVPQELENGTIDEIFEGFDFNNYSYEQVNELSRNEETGAKEESVKIYQRSKKWSEGIMDALKQTSDKTENFVLADLGPLVKHSEKGYLNELQEGLIQEYIQRLGDTTPIEFKSLGKGNETSPAAHQDGKVLINSDYIGKAITGDGIARLILHEVGHVVTAPRLDPTNKLYDPVFANAVESMMKEMKDTVEEQPDDSKAIKEYKQQRSDKMQADYLYMTESAAEFFSMAHDPKTKEFFEWYDGLLKLKAMDGKGKVKLFREKFVDKISKSFWGEKTKSSAMEKQKELMKFLWNDEAPKKAKPITTADVETARAKRKEVPQDQQQMDMMPGEEIDYTLKAVNILQSSKAQQVFAKGEKNKWSMDKILTELQVPKEQKALISKIGLTDPSDIAMELATKYGSYTVESVETKKEKSAKLHKDGVGWSPWSLDGKSDSEMVPTEYYRQLTVDGGINYRENEIRTPFIAPSIMGHPRFATDKGIGWFRSDDQGVISTDYPLSFEDDYGGTWEKIDGTWHYTDENGDIGQRPDLHDDDIYSVYDKKYEDRNYVAKRETNGTRRILEVQSDLFQKGRNKTELTANHPDATWSVEYEYVKEANYNENENQFLQLLNQDNNWVKFFIKTIMQDSAKKGYKKVLFPKGTTAAKIEGHETIVDQIKRIDDVVKDVEINPSRYSNSSGNSWIYPDVNFTIVEDSKEKFIDALNLQRDRYKTEGLEKIAPIEAFYEKTIGNVLTKQYGKDNIKVITDEHGNQWNEITVTNEHKDSFDFMPGETDEESSPDEKFNRLVELMDEMYADFEEEENEVAKNEVRENFRKLQDVFQQNTVRDVAKVLSTMPKAKIKEKIMNYDFELPDTWSDGEKEVYKARIAMRAMNMEQKPMFAINWIETGEQDEQGEFIFRPVPDRIEGGLFADKKLQTVDGQIPNVQIALINLAKMLHKEGIITQESLDRRIEIATDSPIGAIVGERDDTGGDIAYGKYGNEELYSNYNRTQLARNGYILLDRSPGTRNLLKLFKTPIDADTAYKTAMGLFQTGFYHYLGSEAAGNLTKRFGPMLTKMDLAEFAKWYLNPDHQVTLKAWFPEKNFEKDATGQLQRKQLINQLTEEMTIAKTNGTLETTMFNKMKEVIKPIFADYIRDAKGEPMDSQLGMYVNRDTGMYPDVDFDFLNVQMNHLFRGLLDAGMGARIIPYSETNYTQSKEVWKQENMIFDNALTRFTDMDIFKAHYPEFAGEKSALDADKLRASNMVHKPTENKVKARHGVFSQNLLNAIIKLKPEFKTHFAKNMTDAVSIVVNDGYGAFVQKALGAKERPWMMKTKYYEFDENGNHYIQKDGLYRKEIYHPDIQPLLNGWGADVAYISFPTASKGKGTYRYTNEPLRQDGLPEGLYIAKNADGTPVESGESYIVGPLKDGKIDADPNIGSMLWQDSLNKILSGKWPSYMTRESTVAGEGAMSFLSWSKAGKKGRHGSFSMNALPQAAKYHPQWRGEIGQAAYKIQDNYMKNIQKKELAKVRDMLYLRQYAESLYEPGVGLVEKVVTAEQRKSLTNAVSTLLNNIIGSEVSYADNNAYSDLMSREELVKKLSGVLARDANGKIVDINLDQMGLLLGMSNIIATDRGQMEQIAMSPGVDTAYFYSMRNSIENAIKTRGKGFNATLLPDLGVDPEQSTLKYIESQYLNAESGIEGINKSLDQIDEQVALYRQLYAQYVDPQTGQLRGDKGGVFITESEAKKHGLKIGQNVFGLFIPADSAHNLTPLTVVGIIPGEGGMVASGDYLTKVLGKDYDKDGGHIVVASEDMPQADLDILHGHLKDIGINKGVYKQKDAQLSEMAKTKAANVTQMFIEIGLPETAYRDMTINPLTNHNVVKTHVGQGQIVKVKQLFSEFLQDTKGWEKLVDADGMPYTGKKLHVKKNGQEYTFYVKLPDESIISRFTQSAVDTYDVNNYDVLKAMQWAHIDRFDMTKWDDTAKRMVTEEHSRDDLFTPKFGEMVSASLVEGLSIKTGAYMDKMTYASAPRGLQEIFSGYRSSIEESDNIRNSTYKELMDIFDKPIEKSKLKFADERFLESISRSPVVGHGEKKFSIASFISAYEEQGDVAGGDQAREQFGSFNLKKIISGGQTGIDRLGLEVGKKNGYETGGTATPGFVTENGKDLSLKDYGLVEADDIVQQGKSGKEFYLPRTEANAKNSDGTVYFASDTDNAGFIATKRFADKHNKPFLKNPTAKEFANWLQSNNIETLNIAGNRGSKLTPQLRKLFEDAMSILNKQQQAVSAKHRIPMNFEDGTNGARMRPEFAGKSTMELIKEGVRTATSRDMSKEYNQHAVKTGDVVEFFAKSGKSKGESVKVRVTKDPYSITDISPEEWSKLEGWDTNEYDKILKDGNYQQFQYELITQQAVPAEQPKKWARYSDNGFEVSTKGDETGKQFSAMIAKLSNGQTIETAYQLAKGTGKGKPAADPDFDYWGTYKGLWQQWAAENPDMIELLRTASQGKDLTDQHANTENNQARALAEILNETSRNSVTTAEKRPVLVYDMGYNTDKSATTNQVKLNREAWSILRRVKEQIPDLKLYVPNRSGHNLAVINAALTLDIPTVIIDSDTNKDLGFKVYPSNKYHLNYGKNAYQYVNDPQGTAEMGKNAIHRQAIKRITEKDMPTVISAIKNKVADETFDLIFTGNGSVLSTLQEKLGVVLDGSMDFEGAFKAAVRFDKAFTPTENWQSIAQGTLIWDLFNNGNQRKGIPIGTQLYHKGYGKSHFMLTDRGWIYKHDNGKFLKEYNLAKDIYNPNGTRKSNEFDYSIFKGELNVIVPKYGPDGDRATYVGKDGEERLSNRTVDVFALNSVSRNKPETQALAGKVIGNISKFIGNKLGIHPEILSTALLFHDNGKGQLIDRPIQANVQKDLAFEEAMMDQFTNVPRAQVKEMIKDITVTDPTNILRGLKGVNIEPKVGVTDEGLPTGKLLDSYFDELTSAMRYAGQPLPREGKMDFMPGETDIVDVAKKDDLKFYRALVKQAEEMGLEDITGLMKGKLADMKSADYKKMYIKLLIPIVDKTLQAANLPASEHKYFMNAFKSMYGLKAIEQLHDFYESRSKANPNTAAKNILETSLRTYATQVLSSVNKAINNYLHVEKKGLVPRDFAFFKSWITESIINDTGALGQKTMFRAEKEIIRTPRIVNGEAYSGDSIHVADLADLGYQGSYGPQVLHQFIVNGIAPLKFIGMTKNSVIGKLRDYANSNAFAMGNNLSLLSNINIVPEMFADLPTDNILALQDSLMSIVDQLQTSSSWGINESTTGNIISGESFLVTGKNAIYDLFNNESMKTLHGSVLGYFKDRLAVNGVLPDQINSKAFQLTDAVIAYARGKALSDVTNTTLTGLELMVKDYADKLSVRHGEEDVSVSMLRQAVNDIAFFREQLTKPKSVAAEQQANMTDADIKMQKAKAFHDEMARMSHLFKRLRVPTRAKLEEINIFKKYADSQAAEERKVFSNYAKDWAKALYQMSEGRVDKRAIMKIAASMFEGSIKAVQPIIDKYGAYNERSGKVAKQEIAKIVTELLDGVNIEVPSEKGVDVIFPFDKTSQAKIVEGLMTDVGDWVIYNKNRTRMFYDILHSVHHPEYTVSYDELSSQVASADDEGKPVTGLGRAYQLSRKANGIFNGAVSKYKKDLHRRGAYKEYLGSEYIDPSEAYVREMDVDALTEAVIRKNDEILGRGNTLTADSFDQSTNGFNRDVEKILAKAMSFVDGAALKDYLASGPDNIIAANHIKSAISEHLGTSVFYNEELSPDRVFDGEIEDGTPVVAYVVHSMDALTGAPKYDMVTGVSTGIVERKHIANGIETAVPYYTMMRLDNGQFIQVRADMLQSVLKGSRPQIDEATNKVIAKFGDKIRTLASSIDIIETTRNYYDSEGTMREYTTYSSTIQHGQDRDLYSVNKDISKAIESDPSYKWLRFKHNRVRDLVHNVYGTLGNAMTVASYVAAGVTASISAGSADPMRDAMFSAGLGVVDIMIKMMKGSVRNMTNIGAYAFMNPHKLTVIDSDLPDFKQNVYKVARVIGLNRLWSAFDAVKYGLSSGSSSKNVTPLVKAQTLAIENSLESNPVTQAGEAFEPLIKAYGAFGVDMNDVQSRLIDVKKKLTHTSDPLFEGNNARLQSKFAEETKVALEKVEELATRLFRKDSGIITKEKVEQDMTAVIGGINAINEKYAGKGMPPVVVEIVMDNNLPRVMVTVGGENIDVLDRMKVSTMDMISYYSMLGGVLQQSEILSAIAAFKTNEHVMDENFQALNASIGDFPPALMYNLVKQSVDATIGNYGRSIDQKAPLKSVASLFSRWFHEGLINQTTGLHNRKKTFEMMLEAMNQDPEIIKLAKLSQQMSFGETTTKNGKAELGSLLTWGGVSGVLLNPYVLRVLFGGITGLLSATLNKTDEGEEWYTKTIGVNNAYASFIGLLATIAAMTYRSLNEDYANPQQAAGDATAIARATQNAMQGMTGFGGGAVAENAIILTYLGLRQAARDLDMIEDPITQEKGDLGYTNSKYKDIEGALQKREKQMLKTISQTSPWLFGAYNTWDSHNKLMAGQEDQ